MKLDGRKHLPVLRKDDQAGIWLDELWSLFIFYQMPLWMQPAARPAQEGPGTSAELTPVSFEFSISFCPFFFFFFCILAHFLCASLSLSF